MAPFKRLFHTAALLHFFDNSNPEMHKWCEGNVCIVPTDQDLQLLRELGDESVEEGQRLSNAKALEETFRLHSDTMFEGGFDYRKHPVYKEAKNIVDRYELRQTSRRTKKRRTKKRRTKKRRTISTRRKIRTR